MSYKGRPGVRGTRITRVHSGGVEVPDQRLTYTYVAEYSIRT